MRFFLKDLLIDTEERTVRRGNHTLKLPDLSFDVLVKLIEAAPDPISVATLSESVWHATHVSDDTIAQRIALLRKSLEDNSKAPLYVRTVRGAGYCIAGKVTCDDSGSDTRSMSQMFMDRRVAAGLVACGVLISSWIFIEASVFEPEVQPDAIADVDAQAMLLVRRAREQLSLHQAEETDRAIFMLRGALKHDPDLADARLTLSFALSTKATKFRGGAPEKIEAEELAHALITKDSSNSNAWSALGYALSAQGRSSEALAAYRQAFELDPENASALSSAAYLLLLRGELQQALILEVRAKHTGGASRYAEIQIAQVLELIDHPAADHWRAQAIALNPEQVVVLAVASKSYLRQGKPQAALELLE